MQKDFISIIIPAFNAERWMEHTLDSVARAIDSDCEVIVVNDGSADRTGEIAAKYADADARFVNLDIDHVGPCAARKAGFIESQGDYIIFVDSDDLLPETAITDLRKLLEKPPVHTSDIGQTDAPEQKRPKMIIANTLERKGKEDHFLLSGPTRMLSGMEYAKNILERNFYGFLPGHLYARDLLESIDWDDSPMITHQENFYLLLSMAMKLNEWEPDTPSILIVPSVTAYHYIRRPGSQSALMALTPKGLELVWNHLKNLNLPDDYLTLWGLDIIKVAFIERGIPFSNNYTLAHELRERSRNLPPEEIPENLKEVPALLGSERKRTLMARELARTAGWTSMIPHLSIIIVCGHNIKKVERSVKSVFDMGFRNLEVVLIEHRNTHAEMVALNRICIKYPRVRIVKADDKDDAFVAAGRGLRESTGLSVAFMRPGDLCNAQGLYDAVTRIDYGADVVMTNFRRFNPLTYIHGRINTFAHLRSTEESRNAKKTSARGSENVYEALANAIENSDPKTRIFIYGLVWRNDFIKSKILRGQTHTIEHGETVSKMFLRNVLHEHIYVVTQDKFTPPSFEFAEMLPLKNR